MTIDAEKQQQKQQQIDFNSLTITDDFVFSSAMRDKELCKEFISRILGIPIRDIRYVKDQESFAFSRFQRGIRLDVYVEDEENTCFDLEMQTTKESALPRRSRYYHSMIDLSLIEKGTLYRQLKNCVVIFICTQDPFQEGLGLYHFGTFCRERPELEYDDGAETVFVNAKGNREGLDTQLAGLLDYISGREVSDAFTDRLDRKVSELVTDEKWRADYMTLEMKLQDKLEQGRAEGRVEGRAEGRAEGMDRLNSLYAYLISQNRTEELKKCAQDRVYRQKLLEAYATEKESV